MGKGRHSQSVPRRPLLGRHPGPIDESLPEQALGRLIEVDDGALRVNQEYGRRELRGEAPRQDQDGVALPAYRLLERSLLRGSGTSRSRVRPARNAPTP